MEEEDRSVYLSELQAKLRKLEQDHLHEVSDPPQKPMPKPRTNLPGGNPQQATPKPIDPAADSQWKPQPTPCPRRKPRNHKKTRKVEPVPVPETLHGDEWLLFFDLSTDRKKVLFGLGLATLLGATLLHRAACMDKTGRIS